MQDNRPESIEGLTQADLDHLLAENAKWRERVPRLATALQTRTEELSRLKQNSDSGSTTSGAHQLLVEETQSQLEQAKQRYRKCEGELKSCELQIEDLSGEVTSWKGKWSELANSLDERERDLAALDTRFKESEVDRESLIARNRDVLQTAEMAHKEIELLTQTATTNQSLIVEKDRQLEDLQSQSHEQQSLIERHTQEIAENVTTLETAVAENEEAGLQLAETKETLAVREQRVEDLDRKIQEQDSMLERFRTAADEAEAREQQLVKEIRDGSAFKDKASHLQQRLHEVSDENAELKDALELAQKANSEMADEASSIAVDNQEMQNDYREAVRDKHQANESLNVLLAESDSKDALIADLEVRLKTKSQKVTELTERLESSKEKEQPPLQLVSDTESMATEVMLKEKDSLIEELEKQHQESDKKNQRCLVAIETERDNFARRAEDLENLLLEVETENGVLTTKLQELDKVNPDQQPKVDRLMSDIRRLEENLRERAKDMNDSEWKNSVDSSKQDQTLLVLNQQLQDARLENQRLVEKLKQSEQPSVAAPRFGHTSSNDDLTQIKGIGPKLASQLNELGVHSIEQLAGLEADEIESDHLLHPFKSRMDRDNWVGQALQITS